MSRPIQRILEQPAAVPLTRGQREELERRWVDLQERPDDEESWEDVRESLRAE